VVVRDLGDGYMDVSVNDDGPGIAPDVLPHIFERFYTGDESRSAKGQSSGLGLAISQRIIEGHGGQITVESELGRGSTFRFQVRSARATMQAEG